MAVLKDTSLCAIVRDEMINPAGGIERFVRSIVPHVEKAVIVDTGSVDGTREKLDELRCEFPQMQVYDRPFDDYINSRNASLDKVETEWVLILDADELITQRGFWELKNMFEDVSKKVKGFSFEMVCIYPNEPDFSSPDALHNPRLFRNRDFFRYGKEDSLSFAEFLYDTSPFFRRRLDMDRLCELISSPIIYHFLPKGEGVRLKNDNWYGFNRTIPPDWSVSPKYSEGFKKWKEFNPKRDLYI